ncbi:MAG TPA: hypothetical protein VGA09_18160 [Candidatus Binatia bacterium]
MKSVSSIYKEIFRQLIAAPAQSRAAKIVEVFGWLILFEGSAVLLFPGFAAALLHLPELAQQGENYFRLVGLAGQRSRHALCGKRASQRRGIIFASLLDRPLVPLAMAILWYLDITPWPLALVYSIGFRQLSLDAICLAW